MALRASSSRSLGTTSVIGILALFCTMSEFAILTPSIAAFSHHFVGTDITTIMLANSITGIVSVPVSVASGALLPRVGFRRAAIGGSLVLTLARRRGSGPGRHVPRGQRRYHRPVRG